MRFTAVIITLTIVLSSGWIALIAANHQQVIQPDDIELADAEAPRVAIQLWDSDADALALSLKEILGPAMELIQSIVKYVAHNPWILLAFVVPALELWIPLVGFEAGGVVAGSLAAAIHSALINIPKRSIFAFLQSYGAGGFARSAMRMAGAWVGIAVLLAAVGKLLLDNEVVMEKVVEIVGRVWNSTTAEGSLDHCKIEL